MNGLLCLPSSRFKALEEPQPGQGHLVVVNSPNNVNRQAFMKELGDQLGQNRMKRLQADARYLPQDVVPAASKYPATVQRVIRLAQLAGDQVARGQVPVVEWEDPLHPYHYALSSLIHPGRGGEPLPSTSVLLFHPLSKLAPPTPKSASIHDTAATHLVPLVQYGMLFRGTPKRTDSSVDSISREQLSKVLSRVPAGGARHEQEDTQAMVDMVKRFLHPVLGLDKNQRVYLEPRVPYDEVVDLYAQSPRKAAKQAAYRFHQQLKGTPFSTSVMHSLPAPAVPKRHPACQHCRGTLKHSFLLDPNERYTSPHLPLCNACLNGELKPALLAGTNAVLFGSHFAGDSAGSQAPTAGAQAQAGGSTPPVADAQAKQQEIAGDAQKAAEDAAAQQQKAAQEAQAQANLVNIENKAQANAVKQNAQAVAEQQKEKAKVVEQAASVDVAAGTAKALDNLKQAYSDYYFVTSGAFNIKTFDPITNEGDLLGTTAEMSNVIGSVPDGQKWKDETDMNFPYQNMSMVPPEQVPAWKGKDIKLQKGGMSFEDVTMGGSEGSAWLMQAMAAVALEGKLNNFTNVNEDKGVYETKFYTWDLEAGKFSKQIKTYVDRRVPFIDSDTIPAGCYSETPGELWVTLLEKAYVKSLKPKTAGGGYKQARNGITAYAVAALLGGIAWTMEPKAIELNPAALAGDLEKLMNQAHYVHCKFKPRSEKSFGSDGRVKKGEAGLIAGIPYAILEYRKVPTADNAHIFYLVKVRSPWKWERLSDDNKRLYVTEEGFQTNSEWSGAWGDNDPQWDTYPEVKVACNMKKTTDGIFWMAVEDFAKELAMLDIALPTEQPRGNGQGGKGGGWIWPWGVGVATLGGVGAWIAM